VARAPKPCQMEIRAGGDCPGVEPDQLGTKASPQLAVGYRQVQRSYHAERAKVLSLTGRGAHRVRDPRSCFE